MKKLVSPALIGGLSLSLAVVMTGCGQGQEANTAQDSGISSSVNTEQGFFLVIEQTAKDPDEYKLVEKHPSSSTRALLRDMDGNEKMLTEAELKELAEAEAAKVEAGTSQLTQEASGDSGGLGLGETILASAAGALIGGMIANKLAGNSNFQQHQQQADQSAAEGNKKAAEANNTAKAAEKKTSSSSSSANKPRESVRRSTKRRR